jgi:hypothetical protein
MRLPLTPRVAQVLLAGMVMFALTSCAAVKQSIAVTGAQLRCATPAPADTSQTSGGNTTQQAVCEGGLPK